MVISSYLPFYLLSPYLPPTSLATSYFPFYLLTPFLPPTSLSTSYLSFYLLPPLLPPTSLFTSYLPFYLLPPFLPPTFLSSSYLPFYLLLPFLPPTSLSTSYVSFYLLRSFLPSTFLSTPYLPFYLLPLTSLLSPTSLFTSYLLFLPHTFLKVNYITDLPHHRLLYTGHLWLCSFIACIPQELPVIVQKILNATITDTSFLERGDKLIPALQFRKENNKNYQHIIQSVIMFCSNYLNWSEQFGYAGWVGLGLMVT